MLKLTRYTLLFLWIFVSRCYAIDVIFLDNSNETSRAWNQLHLACQFYGLDVRRFSVMKQRDSFQFTKALKQEDARAIVLTGKSLNHLNVMHFFSALGKKIGPKPHLIIIEVTPDIDSDSLAQWSSGSIVGCQNIMNTWRNAYYKISDMKKYTKELAGVEIPFRGDNVNGLILDSDRKFESIANIVTRDYGKRFPIFIKTLSDGHEVFFQTKVQFSKISSEPTRRTDREQFSEIMLCLR